MSKEMNTELETKGMEADAPEKVKKVKLSASERVAKKVTSTLTKALGRLTNMGANIDKRIARMEEKIRDLREEKILVIKKLEQTIAVVSASNAKVIAALNNEVK